MKTISYTLLALLFMLNGTHLVQAIEPEKIETSQEDGKAGQTITHVDPNAPPPESLTTPTPTPNTSTNISIKKPDSSATDVPDLESPDPSAIALATRTGKDRPGEEIETQTTQSSTGWWVSFKNFLSSIGSLFNFSGRTKDTLSNPSDSSLTPFPYAAERADTARYREATQQAISQPKAAANSAIQALPEGSIARSHLEPIYTEINSVVTALNSTQAKEATVEQEVNELMRQFNSISSVASGYNPAEQAALKTVESFIEVVGKAYQERFKAPTN